MIRILGTFSAPYIQVLTFSKEMISLYLICHVKHISENKCSFHAEQITTDVKATSI